MRFIEEIVVEEFLPTFRTMLASELRERGRTQSEVADLLGISQSAVSKYAHGEVKTNEEIAGDEAVRELAERLGEGLANGDVSRAQALVGEHVVDEVRGREQRLEHVLGVAGLLEDLGQRQGTAGDV